jgi:hypothetical protein
MPTMASNGYVVSSLLTLPCAATHCLRELSPLPPVNTTCPLLLTTLLYVACQSRPPLFRIIKKTAEHTMVFEGECTSTLATRFVHPPPIALSYLSHPGHQSRNAPYTVETICFAPQRVTEQCYNGNWSSYADSVYRKKKIAWTSITRSSKSHAADFSITLLSFRTTPTTPRAY